MTLKIGDTASLNHSLRMILSYFSRQFCISGYKNDDGCQLSLPARTYAASIPVSLLLVFNIVSLIRTAVAIKLNGQVSCRWFTKTHQQVR